MSGFKIAAAFLSIFVVQLWAETPIMPRPGHGYADLRYFDYHTNHYWNSSGKIRPTYNDFRQREALLEIQFGLTPQDSITFNSSYARFVESMNRNRQGIRDFELGWRHHLLNLWNNNISLHSVFIIPSTSGYRAPLRYGKYGFDLSLWGYRYFKICNHLSYYEWKAGYRFFEGCPSDQLRGVIKLASYLHPRFKLLGRADIILGGLNGRFRYDESNVELNPNYRVFNLAMQGEFCINSHLFLYGGGFYRLWGNEVGSGGGGYGGLFVCY